MGVTWMRKRTTSAEEKHNSTDHFFNIVKPVLKTCCVNIKGMLATIYIYQARISGPCGSTLLSRLAISLMGYILESAFFGGEV